MQHSICSLIGYEIRATDGDLGTVDEFYFDDETWTVQYIVVETGNWLSGRRVLISPVAFGKPDPESRKISVNLTCGQVSSSPDIDTKRPVYLQHEAALHEHYQWPWRGGYGGTFGTTPLPLPGDDGRLSRKLPGPSAGMTLICAAPGKSPATISMPPTVKSVTWTILSLTMKTGKFVFWWWIPATGCRVRTSSFRPDRSPAWNGMIPACI